MSELPKKTFLKNDIWKAKEYTKKLVSFIIREIQVKTSNEILSKWLLQIQHITNAAEDAEKGTSITVEWECKLVWILWKTY
jgi:hypothetical protein